MHKLRIINPSRDNGSTQGTEVWLDDFKLDGVTQVTFEARLDSVYQFNVSMNVSIVEISGRGRLHMEVAYLRRRLREFFIKPRRGRT